jgi:hypothetical protein
MHTSLLRSVLFVALVGGCAGRGQFTYAAEVTPPDLVVISPGVQVIADQDEPIFYSSNLYWRYQGGTWYRSQYHTHGWARVDVAPVEIRAIARPAAYVHYHGAVRATVVEPQHEDKRDAKHDGMRDDEHRKHDNDDKKHE